MKLNNRGWGFGMMFLLMTILIIFLAIAIYYIYQYYESRVTDFNYQVVMNISESYI